MKQIMIIALVLASLLFLSACDTWGTGGYVTNYYTCKTGVVLEFYTNAPPDFVYEGSYVPIRVYAHNTGAVDLKEVLLDEDRRGVMILTYDEYYLDILGQAISTGTLVLDERLSLKGKSMGWPNGQKELIEVADMEIRQLEGQIAAPSTRIMVTACYPYTTVLTAEICLDTNIYSQDVRTQACTAEDLRLSSQGAPVAVTLVDTAFLPQGDGKVKPRFKIHVENMGGGIVLNYKDLTEGREEDLLARCSLREQDKTDENQLQVTALLSNTPSVCHPETIRMTLNEVDFYCETEDPVIVKPNYMTSLMINITYIYSNSISKEIFISRT